MKKRENKGQGLIRRNESVIADGLEVKLREITEEKGPIESDLRMIYTDKKDGVLPGYDIRTDRFEIAREAKEKETKSRIAKTESQPKNEPEKGEEKNAKNE